MLKISLKFLTDNWCVTELVHLHSLMLRLFSTIDYSTGERLQKLLLQILLLQKHIICLMAFYLCWFLRLQGKVIETNYWTSWRGIFALLNSKKSHDSICMYDEQFYLECVHLSEDIHYLFFACYYPIQNGSMQR